MQIKLLADCQEYILQLAELWYEEISKHWVPNASIERAKNSLKNHLNRDELPQTLVAIQNNEPIGMASLRINDGLSSTYTPWLGSLVVNPVCQNKGIGAQLIDSIKAKARTIGYRQLFLLAFDSTIPNWYEKLGWKFVEMDKLFDHPVTVMRIEL